MITAQEQNSILFKGMFINLAIIMVCMVIVTVLILIGPDKKLWPIGAFLGFYLGSVLILLRGM